MQVALLNVPEPVADALNLKTAASSRLTVKSYDFILACFERRDELQQDFDTLQEYLAPAGALWVSWKKKTVNPHGEIGEKDVREVGLAAGLVDVKVRAIDETWSGLKFVVRKADRVKKQP